MKSIIEEKFIFKIEKDKNEYIINQEDFEGIVIFLIIILPVV